MNGCLAGNGQQWLQHAVLQGGQLGAYLLLSGQAEIGEDDAGAFRLDGQHLAPRAHDHGVPKRSPTIFMVSALSRCDHMTEVFNGACAQQQLPVSFACGVGER